MTRRYPVADATLRIGKALCLHIVISVLLVGLVFVLTDSFSDASSTVRQDYDGSRNALGSVMAKLEGARGDLIGWGLISLATAFVACGLFIALAQGRDVRGGPEGSALMPVWAGIYILLMGAQFALWWQMVFQQKLGAVLLPGNFAAIIAVTGVCTVLVYYLATALFVKLTSKPSVPLSGFIPDVWN